MLQRKAAGFEVSQVNSEADTHVPPLFQSQKSGNHTFQP